MREYNLKYYVNFDIQGIYFFNAIWDMEYGTYIAYFLMIFYLMIKEP